jgi:hypothetical protein
MTSALRNRVAGVLATGALVGAGLLGTVGTASAATATAPAASPTAQAASPFAQGALDQPCRRFWHNAGWDWRDQGHWGPGHHWQPHRVRYWRARWYGC